MVHVQCVFKADAIPMFAFVNTHIKMLDDCLGILFPK